jgi:hypothetical protein
MRNKVFLVKSLIAQLVKKFSTFIIESTNAYNWALSWANSIYLISSMFNKIYTFLNGTK